MFLFCGQILDEKSYPQYTDVQSSHKRRSLMPDNAQSSSNGDTLRGNPYIAREHVILNPTDPNYGGRPIPRICNRWGTTALHGHVSHAEQTRARAGESRTHRRSASKKDDTFVHLFFYIYSSAFLFFWLQCILNERPISIVIFLRFHKVPPLHTPKIYTRCTNA
ncbi:MAG: hypothetical protein UW10_C0004G0008 [Candidatus Magasanikbacteria bacterium GW2011_GWA2_43_9]|nr:MAG: hypothetical protein UW10_C0004G0008 [Candidatus Magasanikbacteria bacterium GW2011_GWA2_43_9]